MDIFAYHNYNKNNEETHYVLIGKILQDILLCKKCVAKMNVNSMLPCIGSGKERRSSVYTYLVILA